MSVFTSSMGLRPRHVTELHVTVSNPLMFGASVVSTFLGTVSAMIVWKCAVFGFLIKFYIPVLITVSWF